MNERKRLEYLAAMGIDAYMPRRQLPGALPSLVLSVRPPTLPEPVRHDPAPGVERQRTPSVASRADSTGIHQLVDTLVENSSVQQAPVQPLEPLPEVAPPAPASIRFVLNCWRPGPDLLVIDSHQPGRALPTEALLANILRAVGLSVQLPPAETLRWPVIRQSAARLSDAKEMVAGFLAGHLQARPAKIVWLMGDAAIRVCTDHNAAEDGYPEQALMLPGLSVPALALPSLMDMLVDPQKKAVTWRAIRRLHDTG